jgi:hypothetical protein
MNRFCPQILLTIAVAFLVASGAVAGTVHGTVINRTTGKPAPDIPLTLLNPTAGMVEVGSSKSDAQGQFTVTSDAIGTGPILIRATYHDNSFNTFLPPGRPEVDVDIYETTKDARTISADSHIIIFQPNGDKLIGAEEYHVQNSSNPPVAYFRSEGNFDFTIPDKATLQQVSTISSLGMAVPQASIDKGKGRYAIAYPFRPGETSIRLSYELAYPGNAATVKLPATYGGLKMLVVAPPGVSVSGDGLKPAGQEQGMMVYTHEPLAAKASFLVQLSGIGNPQAADAGGTQEQQGGQEGNSRTESENIQAVPGRLDDLKWPLMIGLAALFALGAIMLSRKQVVLAEGPAGELATAPVFCTSCGARVEAGAAFCPQCGYSAGKLPAIPPWVSVSFAGTAGQMLGWILLWMLSALVLVPVAWVMAAVGRWLCRNLRLSDGTTATFRGTGGEVFGWAFLCALLALASIVVSLAAPGASISIPIAILILVIQCAVGLQILKWFWSRVEWSGGPRLRFAGGYVGFLGWSLLVMVSIYTIIGWAWAGAALYRWLAANVQAEGVRFVWRGKGHEVLWRFLVGGLACILIIPIPWVTLWLLRWVVERTAIQRTAGAAPTAASPGSVAEVSAQVSASLDALKESIFRLELRKQAGTISEEEYARERARFEKLLRDLVKG